ncbi:peptidase A26 [uncultured Prevotella sp.]|uniref:peptidase A26 n=1 Tax=uncultured Prevotella sp. TaxID=159272 RepID=UPI0027E2202B|nr:peptidase A26 [uncultured Prevotella sp.]
MKQFNHKSTLLAIAMCAMCTNMNAQAWDGTSAECAKGDGSKDNPYLIENPQNLAWLAEQVNGGNTFEGKNFKLAADLDMGGKEHTFPMIGKFDKYTDASGTSIDNSKYFKGTFDGAKHIIDNLNISYIEEGGSVMEEIGGTGLFASITNGTEIRNIIIGSNSTVKGGAVSGVLVGYMGGGIVEYCENRGKLDANTFSGGFVGEMEGGIVRFCSNRGYIHAATEMSGIIGQGANNGIVNYCYNTGHAECIGFGGAGIAGALYDSFSVSNSYSIGKTEGQENKWMGIPQAIVSSTDTKCTIKNCYYVKEFTGVDDENATAVTADEMKQADFLTKINAGEDAFVADTKNINNGFPILKWQATEATGIKHINNFAGTAINLDGNTVVCDQPVKVYTLEGVLVASGYDVTLDKGTYVIKADGAMKKVVIK